MLTTVDVIVRKSMKSSMKLPFREHCMSKIVRTADVGTFEQDFRATMLLVYLSVIVHFAFVAISCHLNSEHI